MEKEKFHSWVGNTVQCDRRISREQYKMIEAGNPGDWRMALSLDWWETKYFLVYTVRTSEINKVYTDLLMRF